MKITIRVHCLDRGLGLELHDRLVLRISDLDSVLRFEADCRDVMLGSHRVFGASDLDPEGALVHLFDDGQVLFCSYFHCVDFQLFHLFSTTYKRNRRIYHLDGDIAAVAAFVEFGYHKLMN